MAGYSQTERHKAAVPGRLVHKWRFVAGTVFTALAISPVQPGFAAEPNMSASIIAVSAKKFDGRVPEGVKPEDGADPAGDTAGLADEAELGPPHRYQLVRSGEDVLRIDRQSGKVGICKTQNSVWRCSPVPLAEEAYEAEIVSLNGQIDALRQRIAELESAQSQAADSLAGDTAPATPPSSPQTGEREPSSPEPFLPEKDEQELNKVLDFSEKAMRRFFGLMQDLRRDMEGEPSPR